MSEIGRYRAQYGQQLRNVGSNDTDLATARFGKARVSCWTCPSNRKWGTRDQRHAAVMLFHIEADPGGQSGILRHFELELKFSTLKPTIPGPEQPPEISTESLEDRGDEQVDVCLIGPPSPRSVSHTTKEWIFWSIRLSDEETGQALAARWTWESSVAHELKGRVLHGGLALHHPGQPFRVTCHVRGKVTQSPNIILKFSDRHHEPRSWKLVPQRCDRDLQQDIDLLEEQMKELNSSAASAPRMSSSTIDPFVDHPPNDETAIARPTPSSSTTLPGSMQGLSETSAYGATEIRGRASVQLGNRYYFGHHHSHANDD